MKRAGEAALGASAMATLSAGWAVLAWNTGFAQFAVARGVERGLQAWWCAVAFWLVVVPAFTFGGIFTVRRRGA